MTTVPPFSEAAQIAALMALVLSMGRASVEAPKSVIRKTFSLRSCSGRMEAPVASGISYAVMGISFLEFCNDFCRQVFLYKFFRRTGFTVIEALNIIGIQFVDFL